MGAQGEDGVAVSVRSLGGIDAVEATFEPGVTVLAGRNATNRTSLLRSVAAALGGSYGELNAAAESGSVTLELDGEVSTREFERDGDAVRVDGDPYAADPTVVDLFACLLEANPVRRAVERGDPSDLRALLMRPVDTAAIERRVEEVGRRLAHVDDRLEEIERQQSNRPALEARREELADELDEVEAALADVRETVAAYADEATAAVDGAVDGTAASRDGSADDPDAVEGSGDATADSDGAVEGSDDAVERLAAAREELQRVRDDRRTQERAVASLEDERETVAAELDDLSVPEGDLDGVESELDRLQRRERELASTVEGLHSIVEFNEGLVERAGDLPMADGSDPVAALDPGSKEVDCWTCGTTVERGAIADRLDDLREVVAEKRAERSELSERVDTLRSRRERLRESRGTRADLEGRIDDLDDELAERRRRIDDLEEREDELRDRVESLEADAAEAGTAEREFLEATRRRSELEYERGQLEEQVASVDEEIAAIEALEAERTELEAEREDLRSERRELRGRIDALETDVVETFNEEMATVLDLLGYGNVERVWIERVGDDGDGSAFDLHVVREDDGVYEDTLDHLSESEREVIGLVVALAGYLVHDVEEVVPVVLLDSLEAIDADRIATLVDYFAQLAPYLLVALLPEDARALPERHRRLRMGADAA